MSGLAARCPSCGTVFRVVQDQLRVSEGWVRCGRCAEVFNAIENLVDLEADVANLPSTRSPSRDRVMEDLARLSAAEGSASPTGAEARTAAAPRDAAIAALPETAPPAELPEPEPEPEPERPQALDAPDLHAEPVMPPPFVRRAERAARWRRPGVQAAMAAAAVLGLLALLVQAGFAYRDLAAARWPVVRPWMDAVCAAAGCRIEPPRLIEALAVDSSGLLRVEGTAMYRLSVVLRNRTAMKLALPAVDITLTDSQGAVIARRVITGAEFQVPGNSVPAAAELALQTMLTARDRPISGYTIEIFYP